MVVVAIVVLVIARLPLRRSFPSVVVLRIVALSLLVHLLVSDAVGGEEDGAG